MYVELENEKIYYEELGLGEPILILPGLGMDSSSMKKVWEPLFKKYLGYKRYYIDLPGSGKSSAFNEQPSSDLNLKILENFCRQIIGENPFRITAFSYGSYLTLGLLKQGNLPISKLFLVSPVVVGPKKLRNLPKPVILKESDKISFLKLSAEDKNKFYNEFVFINEKNLRKFSNILLPSLKNCNLISLKKLWRESYAFSKINVLEDCNFDIPISVVAAKQDSTVGFKDQLRLLDLFERIDFHILDGSGHYIFIEQRKKFKYLAGNWLKR